VDAVVTKPGYGILSECLAAETPFVSDSRDDFREFESIRRELADHPQAVFVDNEKIASFDLAEPLRRALSAAPRPWAGGFDGAEFIRDRLAEILEIPTFRSGVSKGVSAARSSQ
jgi:hypothetical protein